MTKSKGIIKTKEDQIKHLTKVGAKGGKWTTTKDGRNRSEVYRKKRITLIPPSISMKVSDEH